MAVLFLTNYNFFILVKFKNHNSILSGSDSFRPLSIDEDDELLQYAIQQSLMEAGSEEDQVTFTNINLFTSKSVRFCICQTFAWCTE